MKQGPYIGVTDVMKSSQARDLLAAFKAAGGLATGRLLMAGVMMSHKTLNGLPTKWTDAFPRNGEVASIFVANPAMLNALHYADYEGVDVAQSLLRAVDLGGMYLDALQLDMIWPDPAALRAVRAAHPDLRLILQVGAIALELEGEDPRAVLRRLDAYADIVDDVLLDKSMGRGLGMNAAFLAPFLRTLSAHRPDLGLVVAGGLGPDTLALVEPLVKEFPRLSIDAQGQLRSSGNALDPIEWPRAKRYLEEAVALFRRV